jgi:hypothetical protein
MGGEPALGFLGDSALLIMLIFFAVGGFVVLYGLRQDQPDGQAPDNNEQRSDS